MPTLAPQSTSTSPSRKVAIHSSVHGSFSRMVCTRCIASTPGVANTMRTPSCSTAPQGLMLSYCSRVSCTAAILSEWAHARRIGPGRELEEAFGEALALGDRLAPILHAARVVAREAREVLAIRKLAVRKR